MDLVNFRIEWQQNSSTHQGGRAPGSVGRIGRDQHNGRESATGQFRRIRRLVRVGGPGEPGKRLRPAEMVFLTQ